MIIPSASQYLPKNKKDVPKADLRSPITAFGLLDWAYRRECVRAAGEEEWAMLGDKSQSIIARAGEGSACGISRGAINGRLDVHIDALRVDKFCYDNCSSPLYFQMTVNAEKGRPVPQFIELPRMRCGPKYHDPFSRRLVMIYDPVSKKQNGCELEWEGIEPLEIAKAEAKHAVIYRGFMELLDALPELELERWRVEGRGA